MGKNSQVHLFLETSLKNKLKKEAEEKCISVSELCRQKLRENDRLGMIEFKLDLLIGVLRRLEGRRVD
jgi:hypothetical protein